MNIKMKRGQTGVFDLIVAIIIAVIALFALAISWDRFVLKLNEKNEYNDLQIKLFQISDILISSEGTPTEWDIAPDPVTATTSLGIAYYDRCISQEKLSKLQNPFTIIDIKEKLHVETYNLYFSLNSLDDLETPILEIPPEGDPESSAQKVISLQRYVMLNCNNEGTRGEPYQVTFTLWK